MLSCFILWRRDARSFSQYGPTFVEKFIAGAIGAEILIWYLILMCYFVMNLLDNRNSDYKFS